MVVRNTNRKTNGQQEQMTSAVASTASPIKDIFPAIVIDDNMVPDAEPFSDHLTREMDNADAEPPYRSDVDDREPDTAKHKENLRETGSDRREPRDVEETKVREPAAETTNESETEPADEIKTAAATTDDEQTDKSVANDNAAGKSSDDTTANEASPDMTAEAASDPKAIAAAPIEAKAAEAAKPETPAAAATVSGQAKLAADPAVSEAAARDGLPRVRKEGSRSQVSSLADIAAQGGQAKSASGQVAASQLASNTGPNVGQQQSAVPGPSTQIAFGGEQVQFSSHLQANAVNTPATPMAQAAQQAAPLHIAGDPLAGELLESDSRTASQVSQANNGSAATKAAQTQSTRPAVLANQASVQVAFELGRAANQGLNRLSMHLHPAELGRVDVKIEVAGDGRAMAHVVVDRPETLDALQRDARSLERALSDAGLQTDSGSLSFSLRQDPGSNEDTANNGSNGSKGGKEGLDGDDAIAAGTADLPHIVSDRALDISV